MRQKDQKVLSHKGRTIYECIIVTFKRKATELYFNNFSQYADRKCVFSKYIDHF